MSTADHRRYKSGLWKTSLAGALLLAALFASGRGERSASATTPPPGCSTGHATLVTVTATAITNGNASPSGITVCNMETVASGNVYYWGYSNAVTDSVGMPIWPQTCVPIPTGYPNSSATMVIYLYSPAAAPATNGVRWSEGP